MFTWLCAYIRSRVTNERGQADLIILLLIIFVIYLLVTNRRVVVQ